MNPQLKNQLDKYISIHLHEYQNNRLSSLQGLDLHKVLKRKNPYLYRVKNFVHAGELIQSIVDAFLSSQDETLFGQFLEELAIFICNQTYQGSKSSTESIDLEFTKDNIRYLVSIKSGPNWGNSSQIKKLRDNFKRAKLILGANLSSTNIVAVNGCCYGKDRKPDKGDYLKLCGQEFWEFISNDEGLYLELIEPLGKSSKSRNDELNLEYSRIINRFTALFLEEFCENGLINWEKLLTFNSGKSS